MLDFLMSSIGGSVPWAGASWIVVMWFIRLTMSRICSAPSFAVFIHFV